MNPQPLQEVSRNDQIARKNREWRLTFVMLAAAVALGLAGRGGSTLTTAAAALSGSQVVINNHLYVPCSVSGCSPSPAVINNHLYVPCSVSGCGTSGAMSAGRRLPVPSRASAGDSRRPIVADPPQTRHGVRA